MSVIVFIPGREKLVPTIVRNMTNRTVYSVDVKVTARDDKGEIYAVGSGRTFAPEAVHPGEIAFGYVFLKVDMEDGYKFEFEVNTREKNRRKEKGLQIIEHKAMKTDKGYKKTDFLMGTIKNQHSTPLIYSQKLFYACFSDDGKLLKVNDRLVNMGDVPSGGTISFEADTSLESCSKYLLYAKGRPE